MKPIPEITVERTWQEVAGFSLDRGKNEMMKIGNSQPELLAFIMESSQVVRELAIYMFVVVYRMFQQAHKKVKKISSEEIIERYEYNESLMESLEGAHEKFLDMPVLNLLIKQPDCQKIAGR